MLLLAGDVLLAGRCLLGAGDRLDRFALVVSFLGAMMVAVVVVVVVVEMVVEVRG